VNDSPVSRRSFMQAALDWIERAGNRVPDPVVIFLALAALVILLSHVLYLWGVGVTYQAINPENHRLETSVVTVKSLLTGEGIRFMLTSAIRNFTGFGPVGIILVAMVGVGLAEEAGLMRALIHKVVMVAPARAMTFILVFLGALSSIATDAGYLVLIPLGAAAFQAIGRHPLAGLAASFAGVAAVFAANILIVPLDGILTEVTNDAIHLLNPSKSLDITANFYFSVVSTILLAFAVTVVSERIVEPRLGAYHGEVAAGPGAGQTLSAAETRGLRYALVALVLFVLVLGLLTLPAAAPLRHPETGALVGNSPLMDSLILLIMLAFLAIGAAYGIGAGTIRTLAAGIKAVTKTIAGLAGLLLLFLVMSQFIAYFNFSNMATIAAVNMANWLQGANVSVLALLIGFVVVIAVLDILITGAIPKWAIFAPIFVPLFMSLGVSPELVLAAYRVGDSPVNVVTPLMPYFPMIVVFAQKYDKSAGVGTIVAMMLPYTVATLIVWTILLVVWFLLGIPLGPA